MDPHAAPSAMKAFRVYDQVLSTDCPVSFPLEPVDATPTLHLERAKAPLLAEQPPETPLYETEMQTEAGQPVGSLYRLGARHLYRVSEIADFEIDGTYIRYWPHTSESRAVEYFLLGVILPLWLELEGQPVLHCSAIEAEGQAIVFLAPTHTGKSSLAASFMQCGRRMVTDDVLPLRFDDEGIFGIPSFPVLRMWPDQAARFVGTERELDLIRMASKKRWVPTGALLSDGFRTEPLPVRAAYLLERSPEDATTKGPRFEAMSKPEAVLELIRHSFLGRPVQTVGLAPRRLELFARFAREIPMRKLSYPSGLEQLPQICEAILKNARGAAPMVGS